MAAHALDWLPDDLVIAGLDRQATIQLAQLMEAAAAAGAKVAFIDREHTVCVGHLDQVRSVETKQAHDRLCIYGEPDSVAGGLVGRMRDVEASVGAIRKFGWMLLGATVSSVVAAVVGLIVALSGVGG